ncbi:hypothetical protein ACVOMT_06415 [Sphingomonas panni]
MSPFIAIDWGTTNRRAYRVEDGRIAATLRSPQGCRPPRPTPIRPNWRRSAPNWATCRR